MVPWGVADLSGGQVKIAKTGLNAVAIVAFEGDEKIPQRIEYIGARSSEDAASWYKYLYGLILADRDRLGFAVALIGYRVTGRNREGRDIGLRPGKSLDRLLPYFPVG